MTSTRFFAGGWGWLDAYGGDGAVASVHSPNNYFQYPAMGPRLERESRYININAADHQNAVQYPECQPRVDPDPRRLGRPTWRSTTSAGSTSAATRSSTSRRAAMGGLFAAALRACATRTRRTWSTSSCRARLRRLSPAAALSRSPAGFSGSSSSRRRLSSRAAAKSPRRARSSVLFWSAGRFSGLRARARSRCSSAWAKSRIASQAPPRLLWASSERGSRAAAC